MKTRVYSLIAITSLLVAILVFGGSAFAASGDKTTTVTGRVIRWSGEPVAGATLSARPWGTLAEIPPGKDNVSAYLASTKSDVNGNYTLNIPNSGTYAIHISTLGTWYGYDYTAITLNPGDVASQVFFLVGPRDVKEVTPMPTMIIVPQNTPVQPTVRNEPTTATATPINQVLPITGGKQPTVIPQQIPNTGLGSSYQVENPSNDLHNHLLVIAILLAAISLIATGLRFQKIRVANK